jgi:alkanesulfonate monooxygenase
MVITAPRAVYVENCWTLRALRWHRILRKNATSDQKEGKRMSRNGNSHIEIFSTTPQSKDFPRETYVQRVIDVARWSEQAGCTGILVYTDNSIVDPWSVSHIIVQNTTSLCPLIAVQPIYMHPYWVAKMVTAFAHLYGRRICLNMLAGGFKNDLVALDDTTPHDQRYARLVEYTTIIKLLLSGPEPVTFEGQFYKIRNLKMAPSIPPELFPGILMSGSSEAGVAAAVAVGATIVQYPKPAKDCTPDPATASGKTGIRVGVIARPTTAEAWGAAQERFPGDRKGQLAHQLAMRVSDSVWHKQLSDMIEETGQLQGVYWMWPFQNHQTFCPYLVGSYEEVSEEMSRYMQRGFASFILDIPSTREELGHIETVFQQALHAKAGL